MKTLPSQLLAAPVFAVLGWSSSHAAFLEDTTVELGRIHGNSPEDITALVSQFVTVGPGVEALDFGAHEPSGLPGFLNVDITDTQVILTASRDLEAANLEFFQIFDFFHTVPLIGDVVVEPETNWPGIDPSRITSLSEMVGVDFGTLGGKVGQRIVLTVIPQVPEPTSLAIATPALAAMAIKRCVV